MFIKAVVIDGDYTFNRVNQPVIRLYCKNIENDENIVLHVLGFEPYIYLGDCGLNIFELKELVEKTARGYIKRVDITKKFKPIGYQIEKSSMLRIVLFSPKVVPDLRKLLKESIKEVTDSQIYEADIPFINRYLVDYDINGMDIIEFDEKGKELQNYGLNCNKLYICNLGDVKVLKNEIISISY